ncbi:MULTISPECIES: hypothetical protein [unclassified Salinibacterium]|uniref:hypothetical protein n=1 Tax=unclassified Salinibacterium TaxID=2632331 RepID=UPI001E587E5D|nr:MULTISPECIES: hypothetical protein [unclassified Salinibacterium]
MPKKSRDETDVDAQQDKLIKRHARGEHRWPAAAGVLVVLASYAFLPTVIMPVPVRIVVVALGLVMLIPVIALNPVRLVKQTSWSRTLSVGLALLLAIANVAALVFVVIVLVTTGAKDGPSMLLAATQVWLTNMIAFALVYWELDRGGPVTRHTSDRSALPLADFRFAQDEDHDAIDEVKGRSSAAIGWTPSFTDYLYESAIGSMAFSPGAAMPLSPRVKLLLLVQSLGAFIMLALVIAHAVGQLGS